MLKVKVTPNYNGFTIFGDYEDLNYLYDAFMYFLHDDFDEINHYYIENVIYALLYDIRHAYQGDREAILVDNNIDTDEKRNWLNIKKKDATNNNVYYSFNIIVTELITTMVAMKCIIETYGREGKQKVNETYKNCIEFFYSLVLDALSEVVTPVRMNKIRKGIKNSFTVIDDFCNQWFYIATCDYVKLSKDKRLKEIVNILDRIYNHRFYNEYYRLFKEIRDYAKEHNCPIGDIECCDYPEEIEW